VRTLEVLLVQSIKKLKPQSDLKIWHHDEWRYYNALYFPTCSDLTYTAAQIMTRSKNPPAPRLIGSNLRPRTDLHNWQNTARD